ITERLRNPPGTLIAVTHGIWPHSFSLPEGSILGVLNTLGNSYETLRSKRKFEFTQKISRFFRSFGELAGKYN
ncbi:MAG: hypothetical protein AB2735_12190, partial [Candidatus Thiodiazotropha taylori]